MSKLARKDPRWRLPHAIPVGEQGSDIDHLVIAPPGVFTLNAKHHPNANLWVAWNTFLVNGHRQKYVRNSRHEGARASRLIGRALGHPVSVTPVIVPVGAAELTIKTPPDGVMVVNRRRLRALLSGLLPIFAAEHVMAIFEVARRSSSWQPAG